jgi:phosphate transport system substrate-binding protein
MHNGRMNTRPIVGVVAAGAFFAVVALVAASPSALNLVGAGATFPEPLYRRFLGEFGRTAPLALVSYRAIGSGAGVAALQAKQAAFADTDFALDDAALADLGGDVVEVPLCAGAVVPVVNLGSFTGQLHVDAALLADIYLGRVTRWNDARVAALNPALATGLPDLAIVPVRRDDSGTTEVFAHYLANHSDDVRARLLSKSPFAGVGAAAVGSAGVVDAVRAQPGAIGYVEERYAAEAKLATALVANSAGRFVAPNVAAIEAAETTAEVRAENGRVTAALWDQPSPDAYPIVSFTYVVVYRDLREVKTDAEAKALLQYLRWAEHDGQKLVARFGFAPVPARMRESVDAALARIKR